MAAVEWIVAEYGYTFEKAVWDFPMILAVIMLPVRNERNGGDTGPSYAVNAAIDARNRCREWLETHYTLTNKPITEVGWVLG